MLSLLAFVMHTVLKSEVSNVFIPNMCIDESKTIATVITANLSFSQANHFIIYANIELRILHILHAISENNF
jgi:hypothetical protein